MGDDELEDFFDEIGRGELESVAARLVADSSVANAGYEGGSRPLHRVRHAAMARLLLERGANPNAKGVEDETPLHHCAKQGYPQPVPVLLEAGAHVDALDERGMTPLEHAVLEPSVGSQIAQMLIEAGAKYSIDAAVGLGDLEGATKILFENPRAVADGRSADDLLSSVLVSGNCPGKMREPILRLLLENGVQIDSEGLKRNARFCEATGHVNLARVIQEYCQTE